MMDWRVKQGIRIKAQMLENGMTPGGHALWTEREHQVLRQLFPDFDAMCKALPHRSRRAITKRCNIMGMSMPLHRYTAAEISKLRRMYPRAPKEEIIAALPPSKWTAIQGTAHRHHIYRARRPYKPSADPVMNVFLEKLLEIGWYLTEIDEQVRTSKYFRWQNWRRDGVNYKKLGKAVRSLGGQFEIKWKVEDD